MTGQAGNNNAVENDEELLYEEDEEREYKDELLEQDQQQFGLLTQLVIGASFLPLAGFNRKKRLFDSLKDPNIADRLFDLDNPVKLYRIRYQLREAEGILKQPANLKRGRAEARFLFWKTTLTAEEHRRATYATVVARALHRSLGLQEREIKIQAVIGRFGLSEPNAAVLRSNLTKWMKENPGKSIDGYLLTEGRKSYLTQCSQQGVKVDQNNLVEREKNLAEDLAFARKKAIEDAKEKIARGKQITAEILNSQNPELTIHELREKTKEVTLPTQPQPAVPPPLPPEARIAQLEREIAGFEAKGFRKEAGDLVSIRKREEELRRLKAAVPVAPQSVPMPAHVSFLDKLKTRLFGQIASNPVFGKLKDIFGRFDLKNLITNKILKSAAFATLKKALTGLATGGIGIAVDLGLALAKQIPIVHTVVQTAETGAKKALMIGAACIGGVVFFVVIMPLLDGPDLLSSIRTNNAIIIPSSENRIPSLFNKTYAWKEFEKEFLTVGKNSQKNQRSQLSWQQFEVENLLSLYADGHD